MRNAFYVIIALLLSSCYDLNNPMDPQASNYGGAVSATTTTVAGSHGGSTTTTTTIVSGDLSGTYQLFNLGSGKAQQTDGFQGASVYNATYSGLSSQKWAITRVGDNYKIINAANGFCIQKGGSSINTGVYNGAPTQLWSIQEISTGVYSISNASDSTAMEPQGTFAGNPVLLGTLNASDAMFQWQLKAP